MRESEGVWARPKIGNSADEKRVAAEEARGMVFGEATRMPRGGARGKG